MLSVIVPVLNEAAVLPGLLASLAAQQGVFFELLLCDGGSEDGTPAAIRAAAAAYHHPLRMLTAAPGRARQMNHGAAAARGEWLLFLHADSLFAAPDDLSRALAAIRAEGQRRDDLRVAGHFPLRFRRETPEPCFGYFFYEAKSRLDLPDCIHGDQGLLLHRDFFLQLGPFDESLPFLEDADYADRVHAAGEWLLLPGTIGTSARRFEREGLRERQTLNALIMNFRAVGWEPFFAALPDLYRSQDRTRPLDLLPVWRALLSLLAREAPAARLRLWYRTAVYVRPQAWQLWFAWRCRRCWRRDEALTPDSVDVRRTMRPFERLTDNPVGRLIAMLLVWGWFRLTYLSLLLQEPRPPQGDEHDDRSRL